MKVTPTDIYEVKIIEPDVFQDARGFFFESYNAEKLKAFGISDVFVQDNHSFSKEKGTLRGLHFQKEPHAQTKLVRCVRGAILDVAVDIRVNSPTYLQWVTVELSAENFKQLYMPIGFAHGFVTLTKDVEVLYKASGFYSPECDRSIRWNDPAIGVDWGVALGVNGGIVSGVDTPILSDKDAKAPLLKNSDVNFIWKGELKS